LALRETAGWQPGQRGILSISGFASSIDRANPATPLDGRSGRCTATDQRGLPRPTEGDGDGTARYDPGAFETQPNESGG
jgi:hypothetical protein